MDKPTHVILFSDNSSGDHTTYHTLAYKQGECFFDFDTGKKLIEYQGDKILKVWSLNDESANDLELKLSAMVDAANEYIGAVNAYDYNLMSTAEFNLSKLTGESVVDPKTIEEFSVIWFENAQKWVAVFPTGKVIDRAFGDAGAAIAAALEYLGRAEVEFDAFGHGDHQFFVRDDDYWGVTHGDTF